LSKDAIVRLQKLRPNSDWARLPPFDRKGWKRLPFGAFAESVNQGSNRPLLRTRSYVGLDDLDSGNLHCRRWGKGSDFVGTKLRTTFSHHRPSRGTSQTFVVQSMRIAKGGSTLRAYSCGGRRACCAILARFGSGRVVAAAIS
jgi:hypothetical protein